MLSIGIFSISSLLFLAGCQKEDSQLSGSQTQQSEKGAPVRNSDIVHVPLFIEDYNYAAPAADTAKLYESRFHNPILAPDGHQVTLGEFNAVQGTASVKCINRGTHAVINLSGLIPNGVYTIWTLTFQSPGFTPTFENLIGLGALGPNDGSHNAFTADSSGHGSVSAIIPAGSLSIFGTMTACYMDEFEVHFVGAYHLDGQSHGPEPGANGDDGTFVEQFGFMFNP